MNAFILVLALIPAGEPSNVSGGSSVTLWSEHVSPAKVDEAERKKLEELAAAEMRRSLAAIVDSRKPVPEPTPEPTPEPEPEVTPVAAPIYRYYAPIYSQPIQPTYQPSFTPAMQCGPNGCFPRG